MLSIRGGRGKFVSSLRVKALFIVNPAAGHGAARRRWLAVEPLALGAAPGSRTAWTTRPGEAGELTVRALEEGFEAVVAVGGDGTFSEALNGFLGASPRARARAALSTWAAGSGCDLARHFGMSGEGALLRLLERPILRRLDAGLVEFAGRAGRERRYFANVVTMGLGGEVARRVAREGKPWGGTLSYLAAVAKELARSRPKTVSLVVDGRTEAQAGCHLLGVANTSTTGGGMKLAPQADPFDGRLELVVVGALSRAELLLRLPSVYAGRHVGKRGVRVSRFSRLTADCGEDFWLNIDGEAAGRLPASFTVLPAAVPFLLPG